MALRIPSPKALTKPEAYLAYKAGILSRDELKQNLYNPLNNYEGWLAKWCGLLETYPTNDDGTPQCLTDEEGLLAYLCGVTDRYPASNSRPDDARISAYIRYLVSARYIRPDHPLNREEFYLSLIKTQVVPSGDPSSDIVIDGTAKAPFVDVKMYGDTFQQTYEGKNLLNIPNISTTSSGVDISVNNGVISCTGEVTASWGLNIASGTSAAVFPTALPAGNYAVSINKAVDIPIKVVFADSDSQSIGTATISASDTSVAYTTSREAVKATVWSNAAQNTQVNISGLQVMVESGSTSTSFEPYVGGQASPNPSYPQAIHTVTGEQTVTVTGKNLFDKNNANIVRGYIAGTYLNAGTDYTVWIPCEENTDYAIQKMVAEPQSANRFRINCYDQVPVGGVTSLGSQYLWNGGDGSDVTSHVYTTPAGAKYLGITVMTQNSGGDTTIEDILATLQIERSSTVTAYTPYSKQTYPIDLGTIELCRIDGYDSSTYRDRIYRNLTDNKWYLHKEVGKYIFNGSEAWTQSSRTTTDMYVGALNIVSLGITANESRNKSLANRAIIATTSVAGSFSIFNVSSDVSQYMCYAVSSSYAASLAQFKEKLATDNLIVYAPLATPTDTPITDTTLIAQLEALKQGGAEEGTTYIKVKANDPNLPGLLYVEAPKYD